MARSKQELLKAIASLQEEVNSIDRLEKEDAFREISEIVSQIEELRRKAGILAEKHDIQFYFDEAYEQFVVEKENRWLSSRC